VPIDLGVFSFLLFFQGPPDPGPKIGAALETAVVWPQRRPKTLLFLVAYHSMLETALAWPQRFENLAIYCREPLGA